MKQTYTLNSFAFAVGTNDRMTLDASTPFHNEYAKADKPKQARMRTDWIVNYLQGNLSISNRQAIQVAEASRDDRATSEQQAYDRARAKFKYHVIRPEPSERTLKQVDKVAKLIESFKTLTTAQQRRFLNGIK